MKNKTNKTKTISDKFQLKSNENQLTNKQFKLWWIVILITITISMRMEAN